MATKEMRAIMITAGTTFLSAGIALLTTGKYLEGAGLAFVGTIIFYIREILKEESTT